MAARARIQKRRPANADAVVSAITKDALVSLLVKRSVSIDAAEEALSRMQALMGEAAFTDKRVEPLLEHLTRERARGATSRRERRVGEVASYRSQDRAGGKARFLVLPLGTLGNPAELSVAFGADRIVVGRRGEVTAADVGVAPARDPAEILAELHEKTGVEVPAVVAKGGAR